MVLAENPFANNWASVSAVLQQAGIDATERTCKERALRLLDRFKKAEAVIMKR